MKIRDIKTYLIAGPGHNVILVKVETDDGLYGIGEGSLAGRDQGVLGVMQHFRQLLIGRDPARIEDIWQECYRNTFWRGGTVLLSAISGLDIALWDHHHQAARNVFEHAVSGSVGHLSSHVYLSAGRNVSKSTQ